jgi:signal transduction histidine kinase
MVKRHELQVAPLDLRQVVDTCIDMLRGECEMLELKIEVQQPRPLPCVTADRVHVQQVLLNLLRNAVDAMAAAVADAPRSIVVTLTGCDDDAVSVQVADHGPGIPEGDLERVFEAFHSTKPLGLGVGLAICRRLIEAHGGSLRAAHRPGGGALFECTLPLLPVEV